jgi:thiol-disulfide isomerase/thioredoxin
MNLKIARLFLLLGLTFSFAGLSQQTCSVHVTTKNIADGTWFYLQDTETDVVYDSAQAKGNRFTLEAKLETETTQALVYEKKYDAYIIVWLAPGTLDIVQREKTLRTAKVSGNSLEAHSNEFKEWLAPMEKRMEQLEEKISKEKSESKRLALIKEYEDLEKRVSQTERNYVRKYPGRLFSIYILDIYNTSWGFDSTRMLFEAFPEELKQTGYGKKIQRYLSLAAPSNVGDRATEVRQPSPTGDTLMLSQFKGKWVLLEFWASWCGPCREENPSLVKTYEEFRKKNFEILAVSLDNNGEKWKMAIESDGLIWPQVSELNGRENSAALTYSVDGIPDNILINPEGKIVARGLRGVALKKFLEEKL